MPSAASGAQRLGLRPGKRRGPYHSLVRQISAAYRSFSAITAELRTLVGCGCPEPLLASRPCDDPAPPAHKPATETWSDVLVRGNDRRAASSLRLQRLSWSEAQRPPTLAPSQRSRRRHSRSSLRS